MAIDRLRTEFDHYSPHSDFLDDLGDEIGVEFSHHTHRSWMRWLAKCSPSLSRDRLTEKIIRVVETLFFNERTVLTDGAEPIGGTLVHEPCNIIIWGRVLTGPKRLKMDKSMRLMLAPKSQRSLSKISFPMVHGIVKLPGSLSFCGSFL